MIFNLENQKGKQKGITLIALVITIIVLLILASITIASLSGDSGVIDKSISAKERAKISELEEKLNVELQMVEGETGTSTATIRDYLDYIIGEGIITEDDIVPIVDSDNVYILVEDKYVFLVEELDTGDKRVVFQGEETFAKLEIKDIQTDVTSNSIKVTVDATGAIGGDYYYYIRSDESEEWELKGTIKYPEYTFTGLTQKTEYQIKVEIQKRGKETEKEITATTGEVQIATGNIISSDAVWDPQTHTATVTLSKSQQVIDGLEIQWQKNAVDEGKWTLGTTITGLLHDDIVWARLWDGVNGGSVTSTKVVDDVDPLQATIKLSGNQTTPTGNVKATVTHTDNESGIDISKCKWIYTTQQSALGTDASKYTGTFTSNGQEITLAQETSGTYYLHVLSVDKAGRAKETISGGVLVVQLATGVSLNKTSTTIYVGATETLKATVSPSNTTNKSVTWSSDNTGIATVDQNGKITPKAVGTAKITVRTNDGSNKSATCTVTVKQYATGVTVSPNNVILTSKGQTSQLIATVNPGTTSNKAVTWKSNNTGVATVDRNGRVTAVGEGTATITVTTADGSNKSATCTVKVSYPTLASKNPKPGQWIDYPQPSVAFTVTTNQSGSDEGNQNFNTANYTTGWRILYNDSRGIQIISAGPVVALKTRGQVGYNNLVSTLNFVAGKYVNSNYASRGRSVGSNPSSPGGITATTTYNGYSTVNPDSYYTTDVNQLRAANMLNIGSPYHLASRSREANSANVYCGEWVVESDGSLNYPDLFYINRSTNTVALHNISYYGVRAVITLKPGVKVSSGDGSTKAGAWVLVQP